MSATGFNVQDADLIETKALPAADASNGCDGLDLGLQSADAAHLADVEFELSLPATPDLVEAKTIIFEIESDADPLFGSPTVIYPAIVTVTGAAEAAGGAAFAKRFRLPTDAIERYLRATATVLAAGGDNTGVSYTLKALF